MLSHHTTMATPDHPHYPTGPDGEPGLTPEELRTDQLQSDGKKLLDRVAAWRRYADKVGEADPEEAHNMDAVTAAVERTAANMDIIDQAFLNARYGLNGEVPHTDQEMRELFEADDLLLARMETVALQHFNGRHYAAALRFSN